MSQSATPRPVETGSDENVPLGRRLRRVIGVWAYSQHRLVVLAAEFADSGEWAADGSPTPAHWLAAMADVETCTAREWIRIGRQLEQLPAIGAAFADGTLSYSKVRALTRVADPDNETELLALAMDVSAGELGSVLAAWLTVTCDPEQLEQHQHQARSVKWRTEPDGLVTFHFAATPAASGCSHRHVDRHRHENNETVRGGVAHRSPAILRRSRRRPHCGLWSCVNGGGGACTRRREQSR